MKEKTETEPHRGIMPKRSDTVRVGDIAMFQTSMHADSGRAVLTVRLEGGERAIENSMELIDDKGYFRCALERHHIMKLLRVLVGIAAQQELKEREQLVKLVRSEGRF